MIGSLRQIVDLIENTVKNYVTVKKFGADFETEMQNFLTISEEFPSVYVAVPRLYMNPLENVNEITVDVFSHAPIQADRGNVINVVSDTGLILQDLQRDLLEADDEDFELVSYSPVEAENNSRLDILAGSRTSLTFHVTPVTYCQVAKVDDY